jgi:hypothetical protein
MKRALLPAVAGTVALLVSAGGVSGASGGTRIAAVKVHVAIKERANTTTHGGPFRLELDGVVKDAGSSLILPNVGGAKIVGGQQQYPVSGYNNLQTKQGTLDVSFVGVSIPVNGKFYNEYGSWKVRGGTGFYAGWKGGGRWADVGTPNADQIEWDGVVTHP